MDNSIKLKAALVDIKYYAEIIMQLVDSKTYSEYLSDQTTQLAVERCLSVVGEAAVRIRNLGFEDLLPDARQIIGFRNILIHSYDGIDQPTVWVIIKNHIPKVLSEVNIQLAQYSSSN
jgi:uncharacterized protein with HEPN domain